MQRLKCIPFVFLVVTVISVLAAWAFHPGELRVEVSASSRSTLRSVTSEIGSAAIVEKAPAQANAGADQTVAVGARVPLDGSHSSDVNGAALTFHWSFVSVPEGSTATLARPTAMDPSFLA